MYKQSVERKSCAKTQIQVRDARPPRWYQRPWMRKEYLQQLGEHQTTSIGSSLKFCLVAEGQAQLYPRFGPTNGPHAAGHAAAAAREHVPLVNRGLHSRESFRRRVSIY